MLLHLHLHQPPFTRFQRSHGLANGAANTPQRISNGHRVTRHLAAGEHIPHFHRPDAQHFHRADLGNGQCPFRQFFLKQAYPGEILPRPADNPGHFLIVRLGREADFALLGFIKDDHSPDGQFLPGGGVAGFGDVAAGDFEDFADNF